MNRCFKVCGRLFLFVALSFSCSQVKKTSKDIGGLFIEDDFSDSVVARIVPKWFEGKNSNHNYRLEQGHHGHSGQSSVHMFFDVSPDIDIENKTINFVVTTPQGSSVSHKLDILSGQHYQGHKFCKQSDIWRSYRETIYKPPFTLGVIPRIFDITGQPQKIIVFGTADYYKKNYYRSYFGTRIIGGFIEQFCPRGGCLKPKEWQSRLVLIGVESNNKEYRNIQNIPDLRKIVEWKKIRAFIENGQGSNEIAGTFYPAYRMGSLISSEQAFKYIDKHSLYFKDEKLSKIRKTCHKLYDIIWDKVSKDSKYEVKIKSLKNQKERKKFIASNPIKANDLFYNRFKLGFRNYEKEYKTCVKYIYPSNINNNAKKHWFFTFYTGMHLLHELGYSFDCSRGIWGRNPIKLNGQRLISIEKEFKRCSSKKIDNAFEAVPIFLDRLRDKHLDSYHYLDYDKGSFGTHQKLYSWVRDSNKILKCNKKKSEEHKSSTFPQDIIWKKRRLKFNKNGRRTK